MKRPTELLEALIHDCELMLGTTLTRDIEVIRYRVSKEGFSFLSITLPAFHDAIMAGIEKGQLLASDVKSFRRHSRMVLPCFLQGLTSRIFDTSGYVRTDLDVDALRYLRQVLLFCKKPKMACSTNREKRAEEQFVRTEADLQLLSDGKRWAKYHPLLKKVSHILWSSLHSMPSVETLIPKHGPGATSERYSRNERYLIRKWPERIQRVFPVDVYTAHNYMGFMDIQQDVDMESADDPVRVVFVPKTQKSPRVIAIEPHYSQYCQQAVLRWLVPHLENTNVFSRGAVNFTDQSFNQEGARHGSATRFTCTMDLSEASDRVSNRLVSDLFEDFPGFFNAITACRTPTCTLPLSGRQLELYKYASMGSALCFPIESMVFFSLIVMSYHIYHRVSPTRGTILKSIQYVTVYGDDLIFPVYLRQTVESVLTTFGLKVNGNKTFDASGFRESCGMDYYDGVDVSPIYLRYLPHDSDSTSTDWNCIASLVETSNQLYKAGYWTTCGVLRQLIDRSLRKVASSSRKGKKKQPVRRIPYSTTRGAGVAYATLLRDSIDGYHSDYQCYYQTRIYLDSKNQDDPTDDRVSLLKFFLNKSSEPSVIDYYQSKGRGALVPKFRKVNVTYGIGIGD